MNLQTTTNYPNTSVHPDARIGAGVIIEPFTVIHGDVEIGEGTWIGSNVTIMDGARIGKNCKIYPGAVICSPPQDLKFDGEYTTVEIGDNTTIRELTTITRGTKDKFKTKIGSNCLIMAYCHIAHDCIVGDNCVLSNNTQMAGHVIIEDWAILGGMCALHQFVRIGRHAFVSGGSLVGKDVPPYVLAVRHPLSYGGINSIGLKRKNFSSEKINHILDIYRVVYNNGMNITQAVNYLQNEFTITPERDEVIRFIGNSHRGVIKRYSQEKEDEENQI